MKKIFLLVFTFILFCAFDMVYCEEISYKLQDTELPIYNTIEERELIIHKYYVLSYREQYEQPEFVMYIFNTDIESKSISRSNNFRKDPDVSTGSATPNDYFKTNYDKGHLAPAADFLFDKEAMSESFYMSNMSPQTPKLNRIAWRLLEDHFRNLAYEYDKTYIITGPILDIDDNVSIYKSIGENNVIIPNFFYKCGIFMKDDEIYTLAFILPNDIEGNSFKEYQTSIDEVEELINMNIFPFLDEKYESNKFLLK